MSACQFLLVAQPRIFERIQNGWALQAALTPLLEKIVQFEFRRGEDVGFQTLADHLAVDFGSPEEDPARHILQKIRYFLERFLLAIRRQVCFLIRPSRI